MLSKLLNPCHFFSNEPLLQGLGVLQEQRKRQKVPTSKVKNKLLTETIIKQKRNIFLTKEIGFRDIF